MVADTVASTSSTEPLNALIIGNNWGSVNWSYDAANWGSGDFSTNAIPFQEWHTVVVKTTYIPGNVDVVHIWLDPDLSTTEANQTNAPTELLADAAFDSVHLRAGDGTTQASFSNIVISAISPFVVPVPPAVLSIQKSGANVNVSWTSTGTLQNATAVTGPWNDIATVSPQLVPMTNSIQFFRVKQ